MIVLRFGVIVALTLFVSSSAFAVDADESPVELVALDLEAECSKQFDDLRVQMDEWPKLLADLKKKDHVLEDQVFRRESLILPTDRDPVDVVLRRTEAVLEAIQRLGPTTDLTSLQADLRRLKAPIRDTDPREANARRELFTELCMLRRRIVLANPLLDFGDLVFIKRGGAPGHCCDQYFGSKNGASRETGLFVLEDAFGSQPRAHDLLAGATVRNGRLQGEKIDFGAFLSPALSHDAKTVLFAYSQRKQGAPPWSPESAFHLFSFGLDGSGLEQLTDGPCNEFDPCVLPSGRVVFISERRGGFGRCHGRPVPTYTLHSMNPDGSDIVCLSYHETNEWNPSVTHDGMIMYTRWDYVDRGAEIAHHPWITTPDGRDARSLHGNWPPDTRRRPYMESHIRAIPGSHRFLSTACAHHGQSQGSLVLLDFRIEDDDVMSQVKRVTPETLFPESEGGNGNGAGTFATAWPLSEDFYLAVYLPRPAADQCAGHHGIYLVDSFGNRELLYRDDKIRCWNPIPLKTQPVPPRIPHRTGIGRPAVAGGGDVFDRSAAARNEGTVTLINVYDSLRPWPEGTKITALRIVQLFPKATPNVGRPEIGVRSQALARGVLGTIPIEEDGSAHFVLPAGKSVYFQALDEEGLAVQSMMSAAYVHPGERLVCQGCHEPHWRAPVMPAKTPLALRRVASRIKPEVPEAWPISFPRLVQPVLDRHCVDCHQKETKALSLSPEPGNRHGWSQAYETLSRRAWSGGGTRSTPGQVGARRSHLYRILQKGHYDVKLADEELRRMTLWIDCSSNFFGAYRETESQLRGKRVVPEVE